MASATHVLQIVIKVIDRAIKPIEQLEDKIKKADRSFKSLQNVILSLGLAFLFTGMMIKRFFDNLLKSIWTTWRQIIDVHDEFFQKTQQLTAAWEFFKFSLMDALGQSPLFLALIDAVISLINWFGMLSPETKAVLGMIIIGGAIAATAMMLLGAALLFLLGPLALINYVFVTTWSKWTWVLGIVILLTLALLAIWSSDKFTTFEKVLYSISIAALGVGLSLLAAGAIGAAGWMLIIAGVALVIFYIYRFRNKIWAGMQKVVAILQFVGMIFVEVFAIAIAQTITAWEKFFAYLKLWDLKSELLVKNFANAMIDNIENAVNAGINLFNKLLDGIRTISVTLSLPAIKNPITGKQIFAGMSKTFQPFSGLGTIGEVTVGRIGTEDLERQIAAQQTVVDQLNKMPTGEQQFDAMLAEQMGLLQDKFEGIDKELKENLAKRDEQAQEENKALWIGIADKIIEQTDLLGQQIAQGLENNNALKSINSALDKNTETTKDSLKSQEDIQKESKDILQQIADNTQAAATVFGSPQSGG